MTQLPCTNHTTGVLFAFGLNVTVTPARMLTEVYWYMPSRWSVMSMTVSFVGLNAPSRPSLPVLICARAASGKSAANTRS